MTAVEDPHWQLHKARADAQWWWERSLELEDELRQKRALRVTSPLTKQVQWVDEPEHGHLWSWYKAHCVCCKRPIDLTLIPHQETASTAAMVDDSASLLEKNGANCEIQDGSSVCVVSVPPGQDALTIWKAADSFETIGTVQAGNIVVAAGPVEIVKGCPMVPVRPEGAVDGHFVEAVLHGSEEQKNGVHDKANCNGSSSTASVAAPSQTPRRAYCAVIWGANAGYTLGALVLAARLKELGNGGPEPDRVLLHTDDVPPNFVAALQKVWTVVRQVDYIDAVESMYLRKGGVFDGVFTKLSAWTLTEYDKVLLLDVDMIPLRSPESVFDVEVPAAFVRGNGEEQHGSAQDGRRFFAGDVADKEHRASWAWGQCGGINAGVILLKPCQLTFDVMMSELAAELHPEHLPSPGPEQDYLTRFFASAPWHALDVRWNYQLHHVPFAFEHALQWRRHALTANMELNDADRAWRPPRLAMALEDVGIVHFSGDIKLWHMCLQTAKAENSFGGARRSVEHAILEEWTDTDTFSENLLRDSIEGYERWFKRSGTQEEYEEKGCIMHEDGHVELCDGDASDDVTHILDEMVDRLRSTTRLATETWRQSALGLLVDMPNLLQDLREPQVKHGSHAPGTSVKVQWLTSGAPSHATTWLPAHVISVHKDGCHVIRFDHGGPWGDTERGVKAERIHVPVPEVQ